ncbi:MAG: 3-dehydroquinate synthase [Bacteroidota bacterium]
MQLPYPIEIGTEVLRALADLLATRPYSQLLVLMDHHTEADCYPKLKPFLPAHEAYSIPPGEQAKHLGTCQMIWEKMTELAFDRNGVVLNLGGGVIGDMGGFVASTYKRGVDFIQIPTTLLSQVDASVGSKLGIDFQGYKNHIGLFNDPQAVIIYPDFLETLSDRELHSGFAEVLKHYLIADKEAWEEVCKGGALREMDLAEMIRRNVEIKSRIVAEDRLEREARKALNFGHTIGHAVESQMLESDAPLLHGEAIALGMVSEAFISKERGLISAEALAQITKVIRRYYPHRVDATTPVEAIYDRALNDKKNSGGKILCTLLSGLGSYVVNQEIDASDIANGLLYYAQS